MAKEGSLLVVDDNKAILSTLSILLSRYFKKVITISSPNLIDSSLSDNHIDVVLLDMNFISKINSGNEGLFWLEHIKKRNKEIQVVVFTAYADIDLAVEAIKRGATDFVVKPWDNDKLVTVLKSAYNIRKSTKEVKHLKEIKQELLAESQMHWGTSKIMNSLLKMIQKVAKTDANILITGENGTGKEMLALEIHRLSSRKTELLVSVDMGAITESLFESELFGHVKGAFTDAINDRVGKFEVAQGGTLFLDEIGNLPHHLQAKLLTALQSNRVVKVGSNTPVDIDTRLIFATNRHLDQMVKDGTFREDLLYRINTIHIELPPLRQRKEDIMPLANLFLDKYTRKYNKEISGFEESAQKAMLDYLWKGNIRELQHTIEKAVIMCDSKLIDIESLHIKTPTAQTPIPNTVTTLEEIEQATIMSAIDRHSGNMSTVALELGVTRQTLYNKIKKYRL